MTSLVVTSVEFGKLKLELSLDSSQFNSHSCGFCKAAAFWMLREGVNVRGIVCLLLQSFAKCPFL